VILLFCNIQGDSEGKVSIFEVTSQVMVREKKFHMNMFLIPNG